MNQAVPAGWSMISWMATMFLLEKIIHVKEQDEFMALLPNRVSQETIDAFMAYPNHMP
jgi:hypothetical protein